MNNNELKESPWDGLHEECGVFGMYDFDGNDVASSIYYKYPSVFLQLFCFYHILYRKKPPRNGRPGRFVRYVLFQSCCYFQSSSLPVSILYAWRYFSMVLSTISCGSVQSLSGLAFSQSRANCLSKDGWPCPGS